MENSTSTIFTVATVSNQISSNHVAWAKTVASYETKDEAQDAALKLWAQMCQDAEEASTSYIGDTIIIHDGIQCF